MRRPLALAACLLAFAALRAENISFRADSLTGTAGSKSDTTRLQGNAFVRTETMEITADVIELFGENFRYITAEGAVTGKNTESQMDFTCGRMRYDRQTKVASLERSVHLVDVQNGVTADAQVIEYNQTTEIAIMQLNVTLRQKDNTCTAAYAVYRKGDQLLEMSGNPKIVQGEDTFRAQEITLNLDTQEITLDGRVSGTVTDSKSGTAAEESRGDAAPGAHEEQGPVMDGAADADAEDSRTEAEADDA